MRKDSQKLRSEGLWGSVIHTSECFCSISPSSTLSIRKQKSSQYRTSDSKITGNSESLKVFFCKVHIGPVCKTLHTSQCLEHLITGDLSIFRTQLGPLRDLAPVRCCPCQAWLKQEFWALHSLLHPYGSQRAFALPHSQQTRNAYNPGRARVIKNQHQSNLDISFRN